jgi:transcription termination factor NusA
LAPAEVSKVLIDDENNYMEVVVADSQLSLAIGRRGQNVRLAAQLIGWKIDVISESKMAQRVDDAKFSLTQIPGITETIATALFQNGLHTVFDVADSSVDEIVGIPGFDTEEQAEDLIRRAKEAVDSGSIVVQSKEEQFVAVQKKTADELLREEMQQLLEKEKMQNSESEPDFIKVKGMGPSLSKKLQEAGIQDIKQLILMSLEDFINAIEWENKDELEVVYNSAVLINNEALIENGEMEAISDTEREKFESIPEVTRSVLLRINAAGFLTVDDVLSVQEEDFVSRMNIDNNKAAEIYKAVRNL